MQTTAPTTPDLRITFKHSAEDLEHRRNAQSGWRNHPFHRSTSSHRCQYQTLKVSFNQSGKRRSYSGISMAHCFRTNDTLEGHDSRQNFPTSHHIFSQPKRNTSIECD